MHGNGNGTMSCRILLEYLEFEVLREALGAAEGVDADELELDVLLEEAGEDASDLRRRGRPEHLHRHLLLSVGSICRGRCESFCQKKQTTCVGRCRCCVQIWLLWMGYIYTHPKARQGSDFRVTCLALLPTRFVVFIPHRKRKGGIKRQSALIQRGGLRFAAMLSPIRIMAYISNLDQRK